MLAALRDYCHRADLPLEYLQVVVPVLMLRLLSFWQKSLLLIVNLLSWPHAAACH